MITLEPGTVEIRLPFKYLGITIYKKVGFRFNILAWSIVCQLFDPPIEFHQIDEINKTDSKDIFEKMILAGALSYGFKSKQKVTEKDVKYWLYKQRADKAQFFTITIQTTILSAKVMGKSMSQMISDKKEEKKN
jgi:hypothetical protein